MSPKPERTGLRRTDYDYGQGRLVTREQWRVPVIGNDGIGGVEWQMEWREVTA